MDHHFSASEQSKGPFDQVLHSEHYERLREHEALKQLREEEEQAVEAAQRAGDTAVENERTQRRKELVTYKNEVLPTIFEQIKLQSAARVEAIQRTSKPRVAHAARYIVDTTLSLTLPTVL